MKKQQWYEIFICNSKGSKTLESARTPKKAREIRDRLKKKYGDHIFIDKWEMEEDGIPEIIGILK